MTSGHYFTTYDEWRHALTVHCGIPLTRAYAEERVAALKDPNDRITGEFTKFYGETYLRQIVTWFERAARES